MKPFNLEAALAGAPVVTRDGRAVTDICHLPSRANCYVVVGVVDGRMYTFTEDGRFSDECLTPERDLFLATRHEQRWVVYNIDTGTLVTNVVFETAAEADTFLLGFTPCPTKAHQRRVVVPFTVEV